MANESKPEVAVVMGSASDWETMKRACDILDQFGVAYHKQVISAHRTPELMAEFAHNARANGLKVIIAGAGGAAHLPGMIAAQTTLPVIGVPVRSHALSGWDSLLSIVQMPGGRKEVLKEENDAGQQAQQGAFTAAAATDHRDKLPGRNM